MRALTIAAASALVLVLSTGCAAGLAEHPPVEPPLSAPSTTVIVGVHGGDQPEPFLVRFADTELHVGAYTYCGNTRFGYGCADGTLEGAPAIGSPAELFVRTPEPGFDELTFALLPGEAPWEGGDELFGESLGGGWWRIAPDDRRGEFYLSFSARGNGGDAHAAVVWTIP